MNKKILIIEDDYLDYIRIQIKLIPNGFSHGMPFKENGNRQKMKKKFLKETVLKTSTVVPEECLTKKEKDFVDLLRTRDSFASVKDRVRQIIERHYEDLRLIICDLQICGLDQGGSMLIEYLRKNDGKDKISIAGKPWFMQEIPIIAVTKLDGQQPMASLRAGEKNCLSVKKVDVFDNEPAANIFKNIVDREVCRFDDYYAKQEKNKKYKVALSFTGRNGKEKHREFVEEIARHLYAEYKQDRIFYDLDKVDTGDTVGLKKEDFTRIYANECEYIVVCLSEDYASPNSPWTQKEWEGIRLRLNKSPKNVIFTCIGDGVTDAKVKKQLLCDPGLWIAANDCRKGFYKMMAGNSQDQKDKLKAVWDSDMSKLAKNVDAFLSACYMSFRTESKNIARTVVDPIVGHITKVDAGEK